MWHDEKQNRKQTLRVSIPSISSLPSPFTYKIAGNRDKKTGCRLRFDSEPKEKQKDLRMGNFCKAREHERQHNNTRVENASTDAARSQSEIYTFMRMNTEARIFHSLCSTSRSFLFQRQYTRLLTTKAVFDTFSLFVLNLDIFPSLSTSKVLTWYKSIGRNVKREELLKRVREKYSNSR